jgi:hypothetical protein
MILEPGVSKRRPWLSAAAAAAALALPIPVAAQQGPGLPLLFLDFSQRVEGETDGFRSTTALAFGLLDRTPTENLDLSGRGTLQLGGDGETGFVLWLRP